MDSIGRVQATISPLGFRTTTNWDAAGRQVSTQTALGALYSNVFDNASRQIASVSPLGSRSTTLYSIADQVVGSQNALGFIYSTILDAASRPIASVNPLAFRSTTVFDAASRPIGTIDALGNRATNVFSPNGSLIAQQNQLGYITSFVLDAASQRICVVDANNGRSTTIYSNRGFVSATQDQLGALTSFSQDANGNNILRVDARNWPATYTIDALNRVAQTLYIDSTRVTNTWDAISQQITSQDVTGITSYVWDQDSRKTATQNPTGINLTQTLDAVANRLVLQDNFGVTSYAWDNQSRLTGIQNPLNERTTIQWDALDREQHRVLGNGMAVSHTYDSAGRETLLENRNAAGVGLAVFTNSYSQVDNRITVAEIDGTLVSFSYDRSSQLANEQRSGANAYNITYSWDPLGNRLQQISSGQITANTFNSANELLVVQPPAGAATTNSWDANGNLLVANTGGALTTNIWSAENKLLNTAFSTGTSESYTYSQDGVRKSKTNAGGVTVYTMDDLNILLETTGQGALQARNTNYPGIWGGLASQYRSSVSTFYGFDSQDSSRILVSVGGAILDNYSFTGFGVVQDSGSGTPNPAMYGGQVGYQWDRANWMSVGQRELGTVNGGWVSTDPDPMPGAGQYTYVRNNPVSFRDPSGRKVNVTAALPSAWDVGFSFVDPGLPSLPGGPQVCCGDFDAYWLFTLTAAPLPCKGSMAYFVQKVTRASQIFENCGWQPIGSSPVYLEVWRDSRGSGVPDVNAKGGFTDQFFSGPNNNSRGYFNEDGLVKYFCANDILAHGRTLRSEFPGGICSSYSGGLPCRDIINGNMPVWWTPSRDKGPGMHSSRSSWDCCSTCLGSPNIWWSLTSAQPGGPSQTDPPCRQ
jgi:RHS repeat-associated protein